MRKGILRFPWRELRSDITSDTSAITSFEYDNSTYLSNKVDVDKDCDSVVIAFWGKDTENDTGTYTLYGRGMDNGPIMKIATGNIILGAQVITKDPIHKTVETAYWVDSITNTVSWLKSPVIQNDGNDTIAYLAINAKFLRDIYLEFSNVGGGGVEMTEVNAIVAGLVD